ncbi:hypothetical protein DLM85_08180 [Hymenobacter edaphi]|uniref:Uncharacterized protein n=2 Tax=Hymenobacter edaphi TaxID=2211146 RepID=A0A328BKZ3_9BACT|nr:hypothetical protein DLM85_08180 [Hymenobacter edaphi]
MEELLLRAAQKFAPPLHVAETLPLDPAQRLQLLQELQEASRALNETRSFRNRSLLPVLDRLTAGAKTRYVVALLEQGITRQPGNFDKQKVKSALVTAFSLGTVRYTPYLAVTYVGLFVFDRQEKRIDYYNYPSIATVEADPLNGSNVETVLHTLLARDFDVPPHTSALNAPQP